jgi:hypothetical protein
MGETTTHNPPVYVDVEVGLSANVLDLVAPVESRVTVGREGSTANASKSRY